MGALDTQLQCQLDELDVESMRRQLRPRSGTGRVIQSQGSSLINFASNDYLGLSSHPRLRSAAIEAIKKFGVGSGASPLVSGHLELHAQVARRFSAFKHAEASLLFPCGYLANLGVFTALARPGDTVFIDKRSHASLIDAARISGPTLCRFPHRDYDRLDQLLSRSTSKGRIGRKFLVTDSVFSIDGTVADLTVLCDLADQYGATTVIDEAHGTGVFGPTGAGQCEVQGVSRRVDIVISTASKALGGQGGIVTGSCPVIESLINRARSYIYTTSACPGQVAAIGAALEVIHDEPQRRRRLSDICHRIQSELIRMNWIESGGVDFSTSVNTTAGPIVCLTTGSAPAAVALAAHLHSGGILAVPIRPPTVAPGRSCVRLGLRADLEDGDLDQLLSVLAMAEVLT